jgi:DNA-binding transcriptional LysR family regulator
VTPELASRRMTEAAVAARDQWLNIEFRHLAALATVAREASFSGAAGTLGYVQSAVSQQIGSLERIVGHRLVHRAARPHSVALTDAGRTLLDHAEEILRRLALAKADIDALNMRSERAVSFGIQSAFGSWLSGALLGALVPEVGGDGWDRVQRGTASELLDEVAAGSLDAAVVALPLAAGPFFALELAREPYRLAAPAVRTRTDSVDAILARRPLVHIHGCPATATLLRRSTTRHSAWSPEAALELVRSGVAVAVVLARDLPEDDASITALPIPGLPECVVGMAWDRDRDGSPAVVALRQAARRLGQAAWA